MVQHLAKSSMLCFHPTMLTLTWCQYQIHHCVPGVASVRVPVPMLLSSQSDWPVQVLSPGQPRDMAGRQTSGNGKEGLADSREKQHVTTTVARHFKSLFAFWGLFCFDIGCGQ